MLERQLQGSITITPMAAPGAGEHWRREQRAVMTTCTSVASHNLKEEDHAQFIPPTPGSGGTYFVRPAAIRAGFQSNLAHDVNLAGMCRE